MDEVLRLLIREIDSESKVVTEDLVTRCYEIERDWQFQKDRQSVRSLKALIEAQLGELEVDE